MPCEPIIDKGRVVGFMCSRSQGKPKLPPCYKCGEPSTRLCDYRSMSSRYETDRHGNKTREIWMPSIHTCDRPMCDKCANHADADTDYCDSHNNEVAKARSATADRLYKERVRQIGFDADKMWDYISRKRDEDGK